MNTRTRLMALALLGSTGLLAACSPEEPGTPASTTPAAQYSAPAEPPAPVAPAVPQTQWAHLSDWHRSVLSVLETQWDRIPGAEQKVFIEGAENWRTLEPDEQQALKDRWQPYAGHPTH